jgi:hypothetical protein
MAGAAAPAAGADLVLWRSGLFAYPLRQLQDERSPVVGGVLVPRARLRSCGVFASLSGVVS